MPYRGQFRKGNPTSTPKLLKPDIDVDVDYDADGAPKPTPFGRALSDLAWRLYCKIGSNYPQSNVFMSPFSISFALAMTYAGANGETKKQLKQVLFGDLSKKQDDELHEMYSQVMGTLNQADAPYKLHLANRVYAQESFLSELLPKFATTLKEKYGSELQGVDFAKAQEVSSMINAWVTEQTNGKINNLISPDALNDLTRMVLVNAIYFKSDWKKKFDPEYTAPDKFYVSPQKTVDVDMMSICNSNFYYTATKEYQVLGMAYTGNDLFMYVFLPNEHVTLEQMEAKMTGQELLETILKTNWERDLDCVAIPKFKLEETVSLVDVLQQLGAGDMFQPGNADFSNINGKKDLFVSDVMHKAFIEVNEEGTEAAAATAVMMMLCSGPINPSFVANRPFLFAIVDKRSQSILFLGRYTGTEAQESEK